MRLTPQERVNAFDDLKREQRKTATVIEELDVLIEKCNGHCNGRRQRDNE